ncbi:hypothetical protein B6N60_00870 [Richelia sinica FACHB-800]|uniref:Uncharacterized protein n=1 Tax=Richelia sinica FACHB-800 TaxID=1357546 RepID=A0A975T4Y1_9NOST|nr:hypothetical protein B6N60_00870 [Richelia sinica FACHB-800]
MTGVSANSPINWENILKARGFLKIDKFYLLSTYIW